MVIMLPLNFEWVARLASDPVSPASSSVAGCRSDMSEDPGVQFMGARSKRTRRQISHESAEGSHRSWHRHFHPPPPQRQDSPPARLPPMSRSNRGYQATSRPMRTPAREETFIDLTVDPETPPRRTQPQPRGSESGGSNTGRLPRFGRNIMETDVVDLVQGSDDPAEGPSSSPEVQFVGANIRQPPPRFDPLSILENELPRAFIDPLTHWPGRPLPSLSRLRGVPMDRVRDVLGGSPELIMPGFLDFSHPSFDMNPPPQPENQRRETYKAPSPVPEGFTRTLKEEDVAVCPNCSWELGTGEGKQQEIWVAKPCGHVYCGECTENRSKSKHKKTQGSQKTKPFSKCQVPGCGKTVSPPTAMFHLYL